MWNSLSESKVASEKPKCRLVVEKTLSESKARRFFYLYKPREIVAGEDYLVGLTIRNEDTTTFNGGKIEASLFASIGGTGELYYDLKQVIPLIPPKQSRDIWFESQTAEFSGTAVLRIEKIIPIGEEIVVECYNKSGDNLSVDKTKVFTLQIASREEIYQKYGVVVALFFSIIAMIISTINAIASIIGSLLK